MLAAKEPDTEELVERASQGDSKARQELLGRHRSRLRRMVAVRMDPRVCARVDPSDVVQESLTEAFQNLSDYLRHRPLPFYAWLRQFALERIQKLHRRHIHTQKRSVAREERWALPLPDDSVMKLARRLVAQSSSPSHRLVRQEQRETVKAALAELSARDREVLVLRHLEQLSTYEIASVLGISEGAVMTRHTRALEQLRGLLDDERPENHS